MMKNLRDSILSEFMKGQHVVHLQKRFFNRTCSDLAIELTYMKIGKDTSGIVGITTNDRSVSIWANSNHLCSGVLTELFKLGCQQQRSHKKNKEESAGRIIFDIMDRTKLSPNLQKCIYP